MTLWAPKITHGTNTKMMRIKSQDIQDYMTFVDTLRYEFMHC